MSNSLETFRELVESAPDFIVRFDRELRHLYVNPAVERATGIPAVKFIGKTNEEMGMPAELCSFWAEHLKKVFSTCQSDKFEFEFQATNGLRYYQSYIVPEFYVDGSVKSILSLTRDITDQRKAEHDLKKALDELNMLIQDKTAKLEEANKKLSLEIDERKQAEEKLEEVILTLNDALSKVKLLSGLLPICSSCKKIRNDEGYWEQMELYVKNHSEAEFSHGICPDCAQKMYPEYYKTK